MLENGKLSASQVSSSVKQSADFITLLNGGFIEHQPAITGGGSYCTKNQEALEKYYCNKFPEELKNNLSAVDNVNSFRNTKAAKRESQKIILVRGQKIILLNGTEINLKKYTDKYGTFSARLESLETEKVCFVENLDSFLVAEQVIALDFVFIHTYGGIGKTTIVRIQAKEVLVFPDYDFIGLKNYLLIKSVFSNAKLFVPDNYETLFATKSRVIKTKQGREQQPSKQVLESEDEVVVKILTDIFRQKKFLEQQAVFNK